MKNLIYKSLAVLMGLLSSVGAFAQSGQTAYFMNLQQARELNPAFTTSHRVYVGLPILTGTNIGVNNNFVNFSDLFYKSDSDVSTIFDDDRYMDNFLSKIKENNFVNLNASSQLLGVGFTAGKNTFSIDLNIKTFADVSLPGDLLNVALKGNEDYVGSRIDMSALDADAMMYGEFAFGFSHEVNERFSYGARAKILLGVASVSTNVNKLDVAVATNYTHDLSVDMATRISGPVEVSVDEDGFVDKIEDKDMDINSFSDAIDYLFKSPNIGFGVDLGFEYLAAPRLRLSAAVNDIGLIRWQNDISVMEAKGEFSYKGIDAGEIAKGNTSFEDAANELIDSMKNCANFTVTHSSFNTFLPTSVNVGLGFDVNKWFTLGALSHTRLYGGKIRESITLSGNVNINMLSATVAYTLTENNYVNVGGGIALNIGIGRLYVIMDNIPIAYNKIVYDNGESNTFVPEHWNLVNVRAGLNLTFGKKKELLRIIKHNYSPRIEAPVISYEK